MCLAGWDAMCVWIRWRLVAEGRLERVAALTDWVRAGIDPAPSLGPCLCRRLGLLLLDGPWA